MRRWKPQRSLGPWVTAVLLALAVASSTVATRNLAQGLAGTPDQWQINLDLYLWLLALITLGIAIGLLVYRLAAALTLAYELDRNGLYITWLGNRAIVPLDQIITIDIGTRNANPLQALLQGIGFSWGRGRTAAGHPLYLFATRPLARCLVIYSANAAYAISPRDQDAFVQDLEQRRSLGPIKHLSNSVQHGTIFSYSFWHDRVVRSALVLALLLNLTILAVLAARYPELAPSLPMQFGPSGATVGERPKYQIFFMPLAALGLSLLNVGLGIRLYARERAGARLLQITSVLVHLLFGIACITIVLGLVE